MLSIFARITAPEGLPDWEQLRPKPAWGWNILLWPVAGAVFLVVFVAGGGSRAATACGAAAGRRLQRLCVSLLGRERYLTRRDNGR